MLNIKMLKSGTTATLYLNGRIDASNAQDVQNKLIEVAGRFDRVVLDLAELKYISSAGLRAFKMLYVEMRKKGGSFSIQNTRPDVMEIFNVTGFRVLLEIGG